MRWQADKGAGAVHRNRDCTDGKPKQDNEDSVRSSTEEALRV